MLTIDYRLTIDTSDRSKLEEALTGSGAKILSSKVLSLSRQRITRLNTTPTYAKGIKHLQKAAALTGNIDPSHNFTRPIGVNPFLSTLS